MDKNYVTAAKMADYLHRAYGEVNELGGPVIPGSICPEKNSTGIKQNVRLQGGICTKTFQLDKIKNGRLAAIIDFNMRNIWKTVPGS